MKNWQGGLVGMLIAGTAFGSEIRAAAPVREPNANVQYFCTSEIGLLCSGKAVRDVPGCLQQHESDLLSQCRDALNPPSPTAPAPKPVGAAPNPPVPVKAPEKTPIPVPVKPLPPAPDPVGKNPQGGDSGSKDDQKQCSETRSGLKEVRMSFDEVNAVSAPVPAECYLKDHGIDVEGLPSSGDLFIVDYHSIYPGQLPVRPSSGSNVLYPLFKPNGPVHGGYIIWAYTLKFKETYSCVRFTRPGLIAGTGITYPQWSAHAFDRSGKEVAVVAETLRSSFVNVPAASFQLEGKDIASVHFVSDNHNFAAFGSVHVDDLELLQSCGR
jgi:hypothetical protein